MNIAVIPARGGSKRIPRKNIRPFRGKPIISYPITIALNSNIFDRVIVSTEDEEIASVSLQFGAEVPQLRDEALADDFSTTLDVMQNVVDNLMSNAAPNTNVCCIYPTTPLLQEKYLKEGLLKIVNGNWDYVFSASQISSHFLRSFTLGSLYSAQMYLPEFEFTRSQDLPPSFQDAGQFYWGKMESWSKKMPIFSSRTSIVELPTQFVVDIDKENDWDLAEERFLRLQNFKFES